MLQEESHVLRNVLVGTEPTRRMLPALMARQCVPRGNRDGPREAGHPPCNLPRPPPPWIAKESGQRGKTGHTLPTLPRATGHIQIWRGEMGRGGDVKSTVA